MSNATTRTVKGVLGEKLGMTQVWDADNRLVPVTVIKVGPNVVTQVRGDADGYPAVQIGYGEIDPRKVNKPMKGHFERAGVTPRRHLVELRTADASGGGRRRGRVAVGEGHRVLSPPAHTRAGQPRLCGVDGRGGAG